nr:immunoglobulin light chain junction region [Macaca mulatta]MOW51547.1 immunoglobulin light chain junction region [Macaca mulatta]MOW52090.1 immunoglobulin light chain junction region [Macaca mulatta]MOX26971.1 immunoglobulin light chain junction region [Macaca mulatta]
CIQALEFPYSF